MIPCGSHSGELFSFSCFGPSEGGERGLAKKIQQREGNSKIPISC